MGAMVLSDPHLNKQLSNANWVGGPIKLLHGENRCEEGLLNGISTP